MRWSNIASTAFADISALPGHPHIAVVHSAYVLPDQRGKGVGMAAHRDRLRWMAQHGYVMALCTVMGDNKKQLYILEKNGWKELTVVCNKGDYGSGNWFVHLYKRDLVEFM